jgi:hypothetical protein
MIGKVNSEVDKYVIPNYLINYGREEKTTYHNDEAIITEEAQDPSR